MGRRIQLIFQFCALVMLGLVVLRVRNDAWSLVNSLMLATAGLCCLLVFLRFLYVFNYSYALAAICNALLLMLALPGPASWLLGGVSLLYGARLFWFSWARQRSESYAPRMARVIKADEAMPLAVKFALWLNCSLLLGFHLMAVYFAASAPVLTAGVVLGAAIMLAGTLVEAVADWQKQRAKARTPSEPVLDGLYRSVRHPNYLGEILLHLGLIVAGLGAVSSFSAALAVVIAPGYIIVLMITEARRADGEQETRYFDHAQYRDWRARTGSLLPRL